MTSQQPSNSYDPHPETSSFRAVDPASQPPLQAQVSSPAPQQVPKSPVAVVLIAVLATLCVVAALVLVGLKTGVIESNDKTSATAASAPESKKNDAPEQVAMRPQNPTLPAGAMSANDAAKAGEPAGNFNNVWIGSSVTSPQFTRAVRDAYASNYVATQQLNATLSVHSEVTGLDYSMQCSDNGQFVTCTGGNNAVVYIG
ncbi:hypothetical protein [Corynebacterium diphtheriae]|uniref:hypothetical protein n=1 Tax=Corynebacterium diphtheriae TaxID=1717 RepID=UPI00336128C1